MAALDFLVIETHFRRQIKRNVGGLQISQLQVDTVHKKLARISPAKTFRLLNEKPGIRPLFKIIVQFQRLVDISHNLGGKLAQFFVEANVIYSPGLVDHHL